MERVTRRLGLLISIVSLVMGLIIWALPVRLADDVRPLAMGIVLVGFAMFVVPVFIQLVRDAWRS